VPLHEADPLQSADELHCTHPTATLQTSPLCEQSTVVPATQTLELQAVAGV
jgi:hypothetical protein